MQNSIRKGFGSWAVAVALAMFYVPTNAGATIIDNRTWGGTSCGSAGTVGSGDCFGATYSLVVDDRGDNNASTYSGTLTVNIGTYTGSMTYIGAVDFKPGNVISPVVLTSAPGALGDWQTLFTSGQAAGNCQNGNGGFLCSYDQGLNTNAPTTNNTTYTWAWNFSLNGGYTFSHLGVNYTVNDDSCTQGRRSHFQVVTDCGNDGENISISAGGKVPEPSAFILLGVGLIGVSLLRRRPPSES